MECNNFLQVWEWKDISFWGYQEMRSVVFSSGFSKKKGKKFREGDIIKKSSHLIPQQISTYEVIPYGYIRLLLLHMHRASWTLFWPVVQIKHILYIQMFLGNFCAKLLVRKKMEQTYLDGLEFAMVLLRTNDAALVQLSTTYYFEHLISR